MLVVVSLTKMYEKLKIKLCLISYLYYVALL